MPEIPDLRHETQRSAAEILADLSGFLTGSFDVQVAMQLALDTLVDYLGGDLCIGLTTLENDNHDLLLRAQSFSQQAFQFEKVGIWFNLDGMRPSRWVIENCRFLNVPDIREQGFDTQLAKDSADAGMRSILYIPLLARSKPIGVIHIEGWLNPREFTREEIQLCQGVANLVAAAIENGRFLAAERKQLKLAQTLQKVGSLLTSQLRLMTLYDQLFVLLAEVISYDSVSIQIFDKKTQHAKFVAVKGFDIADMDGEYLDFVTLHSMNNFSQNQHICVIPDTHTSENWVVVSQVGLIRSWIGVLLRVKGEIIGVLNVDSHTANAFTQDDGETVVAFANQAAIAIENTRLYKETDKWAVELSILHQLALDTASVVDLDELYAKTTATITSTLYPECFGFILVDEHSEMVFPHQSYYGVTHEALHGPIPLNESISGFVIETGKPIIIPDIRKEPRYFVANSNMRSEIAVPIKIDDEVIGVINAESHRVDAFSDNDTVFLMTLAGLLSASISRTRMYRRLQAHSDNLYNEVAKQTAELKAERDRTITILENAGESILLLDNAAKIVYVNRAIEVKTGYTSEQLIGETPMFLESGMTPESTYSRFWDNLVRGQSWTGQLINKRQDGSFYDVALTMAPIKDSKGDVTGFVIVEADITRLKEVERLKTEFVANVTHELRTPLTNIKNYVTLAERGREEKKPRYFQILNHETDRLAQLIQDLLDLSHLDTETPLRYVVPIDLGLIVQEYVDIFQAKFEMKDIGLTQIISEEETAVSVEDKHLGQLLTNLLGNAIAYTPQGGEIVIQVGREETAVSTQVWFQISDNGPGIPSDEIPHLFNRFYRGSLGQQEGIPGTGLGLAICQEIVHRYQGDIAVESEGNKGTTVTIHLPATLPVEELDIL